MMKHIKPYLVYINESARRVKSIFVDNNKISDDEFNMLKDIDPSSTSKYLMKIVNFYLEGHDINEIKELIQMFNDRLNKNLIKNKDINTYSFDALKNEMSVNVKSKSSEIKNIKENQVRVILDNNDYKIILPLTVDASQKYGYDTRWCISSHDTLAWDTYVDELKGTFYFVFIKNKDIVNKLYEYYFPKIERIEEDDDYSGEHFNDIDNFSKIAVSVTKKGLIGVTNAFDKYLEPEDEFFHITGLDKNLFKPYNAK